MPTLPDRLAPAGLGGLRRGGEVTELLFLYACTTERADTLRPLARELGLTVQAASHVFRQLARRGLAEIRDGAYRPTVRGVAWLHGSLGALREELEHRLQRLHVVRSTRAVAQERIEKGSPVHLEMRDGLLVAFAGASGASRGKAGDPAVRGELVRVEELEGVLPIRPGQIRVLVIPETGPGSSALLRPLRDALRAAPEALLGAMGVEAVHLLRLAGAQAFVRFGVSPAAIEASRVGVDSLVVLPEEELPRFLEGVRGNEIPLLTVARLGARPQPRARRPRPSGARARPRAR